MMSMHMAFNVGTTIVCLNEPYLIKIIIKLTKIRTVSVTHSFTKKLKSL